MSKESEARETEVLGCMMRGFSNQKIAKHLNVSEATAKHDVGILLGRYKATNRVQLVVSVWKEGQGKIGRSA